MGQDSGPEERNDAHSVWQQLTLLKPTDWDRTDTLRRFDKVCAANSELFARKNEQYGNAIEETGVVGAAVELVGCIARLRQLVLSSKDHGRAEREAIENVFRDAHNYANIGMMMLHQDNWEGKDAESG